mmetsp:Transcript_90434/g.156672  ORF Transcript_90434/g.156672 Transcript_90434/m.156672 type:complete len:331 (+) Transcript_90434:2112-3104(+)
MQQLALHSRTARPALVGAVDVAKEAQEGEVPSDVQRAQHLGVRRQKGIEQVLRREELLQAAVTERPERPGLVGRHARRDHAEQPVPAAGVHQPHFPVGLPGPLHVERRSHGELQEGQKVGRLGGPLLLLLLHPPPEVPPLQPALVQLVRRWKELRERLGRAAAVRKIEVHIHRHVQHERVGQGLGHDRAANDLAQGPRLLLRIGPPAGLQAALDVLLLLIGAEGAQVAQVVARRPPRAGRGGSAVTAQQPAVRVQQGSLIPSGDNALPHRAQLIQAPPRPRNARQPLVRWHLHLVQAVQPQHHPPSLEISPGLLPEAVARADTVHDAPRA